MLASRVRNLSDSPTLAVNDVARRLRADGVDVLDFSAGQPDFPTPAEAKAAGRRAIDEDQTRYTANAGIPELRRAIADNLKRTRDVVVEPDAILVSPGAKASLYFACQALLDPGDRVLVPSPYWTSYPEQVRLAGAEPVFVPCPASHGFKLTPDALEDALRARPKLLILNYPSNPTGACYSRGELERLAEVCVRHDTWILADEIYSRLLYDGLAFSSLMAIAPEVAARTVLVDGASKSYAMTGWRIGYAAGPGDVIRAMGRLQSHSTSNATSVSQWASATAFALPDSAIEPRVREFQRRRDEILRLLGQLDGVRCSKPEGAFYVFPDVSGCFGETRDRKPVRSGQELSRYLLEQARVAVVPGEAFGSPAHVRLSYALSFERLREGMDRIASALGELQR